MSKLSIIDTKSVSFFARNAVRSGVIRRKDGQFGESGVVFLGSNSLANPFDLGTEYLSGVLIEHSSLPAEEKDRYFTITGGYFVDKTEALGLRVIRVFGTAADTSLGFNITEGGTSVLANEWELKSPSDGESIDESLSAQNDDPSSLGWTFLVQELKDAEQFPASGQPATLIAVCPTITEVVQSVVITGSDSQDVTFTIETDGPAPEYYVFDWGDGSDTDISPSKSLTHSYVRPTSGHPYYSANVLARRQGSFCEDGSFNIKIYFTDPCPTLTEVQAAYGQLGDLEQTVTLTAITQGKPLKFFWEIEGQTTETEIHTLERSFARPAGDTQVIQVKVTASGPNECTTEEKTVDIHIAGRCPVLLDLTWVYGEAGDISQSVVFTAQSGDLAPEHFVWTIGDDEPVLTIEHTFTYIFERPAGDAESVEVRVKGEGPGTCATEEKRATITIPGVCPILEKIEVVYESPTATEQGIVFTAIVNGPAPDRYEWTLGGEVQDENTATFTAVFPRPEGNSEQREIRVTIIGPESCISEKTVVVTLPGTCPVLTGIEVVLGTVTESELDVTFTAATEGPQPDTYLWTLPEETVETLVNHLTYTFTRPAGDAAQVEVKVKAQGPDQCTTEEKSATFSVPGRCPVMLELRATAGTVTDTLAAYSFEAIFQGPQPERFTWKIGQESIETASALLLREFPRPEGDALSLEIKVNGSGPGSCSTEERSATIRIPGVCPELTGIKANVLSTSATSVTYAFEATYTGPKPTAFHWVFGEALIDTDSALIEKSFDLPQGNSREVIVKVNTSGPGACVTEEKETKIVLTGICPELTGITAAAGELLPESATYNFTATYSGPAPTQYHWTFGEESVQTDLPTITRIFTRPEGDSTQVLAQVYASGPGACVTGIKEVPITVPGVCPVLTGVEANVLSTSATSVTYSFEATYTGPKPTTFHWAFGEELLDSDTAVIERSFDLPQGNSKEIIVKVNASGPGACATEDKATKIVLAGICPELTGITAAAGELLPESATYIFTATYSGPAPTQYHWTFGEETAQTDVPSISRTFTRPEGDSEDVLAKVYASGPGTCVTGDKTVQVSLPGRCPVLTGVTAVAGEVTETTMPVAFTAEWIGPKPDKFIWKTGTETFETLSATLSRDLVRPIGDPVTVSVTVQGIGPDTCSTQVLTAQVSVPGICPEISGLLGEMLPTEALAQPVRFMVTTLKATPTAYTWDFGDGSTPETTTLPEVVHMYQRKPGDPAALKVTVTTLGPGTQCGKNADMFVTIPGLCPEIAEIQVVAGAVTETHVPFSVTLRLDKTTAERYIWDWNDGSPAETTVSPQATHLYERKPGDPKTYVFSVRLEGPGKCTTVGSGQVLVQGICPVVEGVAITYAQTEDTRQTVSASAIMGKVMATNYEWEWGDGSAKETTTQPFATHSYARLPGDAAAYSVKVKASGPGACVSEGGSDVQIAGICPEITSATPHVLSLTDEGQEVEITLVVSRTPATSIRWEWGDGSAPQESSDTKARHIFARIPGQEGNYAVRVTLLGPGSCQATSLVQIRVPAVCPVVRDIDIQYVTPTATEQEVNVALTLSPGVPTKFTWEWGDGVIETTTVANATHRYRRNPGDTRQYVVKVSAEGPGSCACNASAQVRVPGICPKILAIEVSEEATDNYLIHPLKAKALVDYPEGLRYTWNWGDGSAPETSTLAEATHNYARKPGDALPYTILLTIAGPESCESSSAVQVNVPGLCPECTRHELTYPAMTEDAQEVLVALVIEKAQPDSITWNWGDGSPEEKTTGLTSKGHLYTRLPGDAKPYTVKVTLTGPGTSCGTEREVPVTIEGYCPVLGELTLDPVEHAIETEYALTAKLAITRTSGEEKYLWVWGDGHTDETTAPEYSHIYARKAGENQTFTLKVTVDGTDSCTASAETLVEVGGYCPRVVAIDTKVEAPEALTQEVRVSLVMEPLEAESFTWNWGDGTEPETSDEPYRTHQYARKAGDDRDYEVTVTYAGPGNCVGGEAKTSVNVEGICPKIEALTTTLVNTQTIDLQKVKAEVILDPVFSSLLAADPSLVLHYVWEWVEGQPLPATQEALSEYIYTRKLGEDTPQVVRVTLTLEGSACSDTASDYFEVPGYCPELKGILAEKEAVLTERDLQVFFKADILYANDQVKYYWYWGDGSDGEAAISATHTYRRLPGEPVTYTVKLVAEGPGNCATRIAETQVVVEGLCPRILGKELQVLGAINTHKQVLFSLEIEDFALVNPGSMHFTWTWRVQDVVHQEVTTVPELKVDLLRQPEDYLYQIDVTVSGSGTCERSTCVKVLVEGTCPHIRELNYTFCELTETEAHLVFHVQLRVQPAPLTEPDTYIWEWGDGSPSLITHTPHAAHVFVRNPEEALSYPVRVTAKGTQCGCETSAEVLAELPGACPLVTAIRPVYGTQTNDAQEVTLIASVRGGTPASYQWDFGDGSAPQNTKVPHVTHAFARTQAAFIVRLTITGEADGRRGSSCTHQRELKLEIPLPEPAPA